MGNDELFVIAESQDDISQADRWSLGIAVKDNILSSVAAN